MDWIDVSEEESEDGEYIFLALSTIYSNIVRPLPKDLSEISVTKYYQALMDVFRDYKVQEHLWRVKMSNKYSVPYDFVYKDGKIGYVK